MLQYNNIDLLTLPQNEEFSHMHKASFFLYNNYENQIDLHKTRQNTKKKKFILIIFFLLL